MGTTITSAAGSVDTRFHPQTDKCQQLPGAVAVGVLVEHALARTPAHFLRLAGIVQEIAVGGDGFGRIVHDEQFVARLEPALDPLDRIGHDRGAGCREARRGRLVAEA